jgi:hypothetical protein
MQATLKSKRRRHRKWEEKKANGSRKRTNSGGSSSGDDHPPFLDSRSHSEEEGQGDEQGDESPEEKGQGNGNGLADEAVCTRLETMHDFRTSVSEDDSANPDGTENKPGPDGTENKPGPDNEDNGKSVEDGGDVKYINVVGEGANCSITQIRPTPNGVHEVEKSKGDSIGAKVKAKSDAGSDDSDDEAEGKGDVVSATGQDQGESNPHRTVCAFDFANSVMFDLDVE